MALPRGKLVRAKMVDGVPMLTHDVIRQSLEARRRRPRRRGSAEIDASTNRSLRTSAFGRHSEHGTQASTETSSGDGLSSKKDRSNDTATSDAEELMPLSEVMAELDSTTSDRGEMVKAVRVGGEPIEKFEEKANVMHAGSKTVDAVAICFQGRV